MDGDQDLDILGGGYEAAEVAWWRNDGGDPINWQYQIIDPACSLAHWVHACDMDSDGDTDVVGASYGGSRIQWWRNEGGSPVVWTELNIDAGFYHALVAHAADIDSDGDFDVLGTACDANSVRWWENDDGLGTSWVEHIVSVSHPGAWPAHVGDLDGDGALEVITAAEAVNRVSWWRVNSFRPEGELSSSILDTGTLDPQESMLNWTVHAPEGTSFGVQLRTGAHPADMGSWMEEIATPGPVAGELERYIQYRVRLATADSCRSPILDDLEFSWVSPGSSYDDPVQEGTGLLLWSPTPTRRSVEIEFILPQFSHVDLRIFSPSGRLVRTLAKGGFAGGRHRIRAGGLAAGVYLCRLTTPQEQVVKRLVVVE